MDANFVLSRTLVDISCAMKIANTPPYEKRSVDLSKGDIDAIIDALHLVEAVRNISNK